MANTCPGHRVSASKRLANPSKDILTARRFIEENHARKAADIKSQRDNSRSHNRGGPSQEMMQYWGIANNFPFAGPSSNPSQAINSNH